MPKDFFMISHVRSIQYTQHEKNPSKIITMPPCSEKTAPDFSGGTFIIARHRYGWYKEAVDLTSVKRNHSCGFHCKQLEYLTNFNLSHFAPHNVINFRRPRFSFSNPFHKKRSQNRVRMQCFPAFCMGLT